MKRGPGNFPTTEPTVSKFVSNFPKTEPIFFSSFQKLYQKLGQVFKFSVSSFGTTRRDEGHYRVCLIKPTTQVEEQFCYHSLKTIEDEEELVQVVNFLSFYSKTVKKQVRYYLMQADDPVHRQLSLKVEGRVLHKLLQAR